MSRARRTTSCIPALLVEPRRTGLPVAGPRRCATGRSPRRPAGFPTFFHPWLAGRARPLVLLAVHARAGRSSCSRPTSSFGTAGRRARARRGARPWSAPTCSPASSPTTHASPLRRRPRDARVADRRHPERDRTSATSSRSGSACCSVTALSLGCPHRPARLARGRRAARRLDLHDPPVRRGALGRRGRRRRCVVDAPPRAGAACCAPRSRSRSGSCRCSSRRSRTTGTSPDRSREFPITAADPLDTFGFGLRRIMPTFGTADYTVGPGGAQHGQAGGCCSRSSSPAATCSACSRRLRAVAPTPRAPHLALLVAHRVVFPLGYFFFWGMFVSSATMPLSGPIYFIPMFAPLVVIIATAIVAVWDSGGAVASSLVVDDGGGHRAGRGQPHRRRTVASASRRSRGDDSTEGVRRPVARVRAQSGAYLMFLNPYSSNRANLDGRILYATDQGRGQPRPHRRATPTGRRTSSGRRCRRSARCPTTIR